MTGLLVSEWIEQTGGAERVLDRLAGLFPDADMLCLWNDAPQRYPDRGCARPGSPALRCAATRHSRCRSCRPRGAHRSAATTGRW